MFKLVRASTPADQALADRHVWPVRFTALSSDDDSPVKLFVMHARPPGEFVGDSFSCVASAQQMTDLPEDEVGPSGPFFRVAEITAMCRNAELALEFTEKIESAVQDLADNLSAADVLSEKTITIITPNV